MRFHKCVHCRKVFEVSVASGMATCLHCRSQCMIPASVDVDTPAPQGLRELAPSPARHTIAARLAATAARAKSVSAARTPASAKLASGVDADRRAAERFESTAVGRCTAIGGREGKGWPAKVRDVSSSGIGLMVHRRFEPKTPLAIEIEDADGNVVHNLMARVIRAQYVGEGQWILGCTFLRNLDAEDVQALR